LDAFGDRVLRAIRKAFGVPQKHSRRYYGLLLIILASVAFFIYESTAYAYIDPGTGTFLWQIILSSLAGSLFFVRRLRQSIAHLMRHKSRTSSSDNRETQ
jgi:hypothetical protein